MTQTLTLKVKLRKIVHKYPKESFRIRFDTGDQAFVFLAPIDWGFRYQRPQSLAKELSHRGFKVLYVNPSILIGKDQVGFQEDDHEEVKVLTITSNQLVTSTYIGANEIPRELSLAIARAIEDFVATRYYSSMLLITQQPSWWPVVRHLQGNQLVFDCMDLHVGFDVHHPKIEIYEKDLLYSSDNIIVTSDYLYEKIQGDAKTRVEVVKNGVDFKHFSLSSPPRQFGNTRIGYFGAIAEWFDVELIEFLAAKNPEVFIDLVGEVSVAGLKKRLSKFPNITFFGELKISELPKVASTWSAGLIPFLISDLIQATNPVKMYEYAAMGLPVVATGIPEVQLASKECKGIFALSSKEEFSHTLTSILSSSISNSEELINWASSNSWTNRADRFLESLRKIPKVSVVILMWNQALMTLKCLQSVIQRSDYLNLEIIVVDNGSLEEHSKLVKYHIENLKSISVKYIKNPENLGFAKGNNIGIENATGDFIVLLNNDTEVSAGWIWRSLKHFYRNDRLGLLGPSTDNCGNEARVILRENHDYWLSEVIPRFNFREQRSIQVENLAFFCVMMPRRILDEVGLISSDYGLGYFEDDDYCKKVIEKGFELCVSRDVFVHHKMSASFDLIDQTQRQKVFDQNKAQFETIWGKWKPHSYALDEDAIR